MIFTDTDVVTAEGVMVRTQQTLSQTTVTELAPQLRVTFSAGGTGYQPDEMLTRTIERADRAPHAAKADGCARTEHRHSVRLTAPGEAA